MDINIKTLAKNSGILVLSNVSIRFITFLLMPLYTRVLSPSDYGVTDTILSLSTLVIGAFSLCIDGGITAFFYDEKNDGYYKTVTTDGFVFCIISSVACLSMAFFARPMSELLFKSNEYVLAVVLGFVYSAFKIVYFSFRVSSRMRGQLKMVALYSFIELIVMLVCNILFILVFRWGYLSILYANILGQLACGLAYAFGNRRFVSFRAIDGALLKKILRYSIPLTPTVLLTWINNFADRYFIGQFHDQAMVGLYGTAFRIVTLLSVLTTSFLAAYPSFACSNADDEKSRHKYSLVYDGMVVVLSILGVFAALFAKEIFTVMTAEDYHEAHVAVGLLCFAHVFYTLATVVGYGLTIMKKNKLYLIVNLSGVVCNIVLNFLLVKPFGYVGAAFTTCAAQLMTLIVSFIISEKYFKCNYNIVKSIVVTIGCMAISYLTISMSLWIRLVTMVLLISAILLIYIKRLASAKAALIDILKKKRRPEKKKEATEAVPEGTNEIKPESK